MKIRGIYKFRLDAGRMGTIGGIFVAEKALVDRLYGKQVHFGEVLGKHSDISAVITEENLTLVTTRYDFVCNFIELNLQTGINPLDYIDLEEEDHDGQCVTCGK